MASGRVVPAIEAFAATAAARLRQTLAVELVVQAARARMSVTVAACKTHGVTAALSLMQTKSTGGTLQVLYMT